MKYLRIVLKSQIEGVGYREGFFTLAYELRRTGKWPVSDIRRLGECLDWLDDNLDEPWRFSKSKSKGAWHRNTKGISWFKTSATDHIERAFRLSRLLEKHGHPVTVLRTSKPGYIVYQDDFQIVAEPFPDTPR